MQFFKSYPASVPAGGERMGKATLFESPRMLLGLNRLDPGVEQAVHSHDDQDKFYYVLEGQGEFTVGSEVREAGLGHIVWAPAGVDHGVRNRGTDRLVLMVGISPAP